MIKDIVDAGGPSLLIPAIIFILVLYAARGLFGLHGRKGQHRKEFLDLWDRTKAEDDLWLEVTVRHQFGTYLPAHIIRIALKHPASSQALVDLSELWALLRYEASTQSVRWKHPRYEKLHRSPLRRSWPFIAYVLLASLGGLSALIAYHADHSLFVRWTYSFLSVVLIGAALIQLMRDEAIKVAAESGNEWIHRINAERRHSAPTIEHGDENERASLPPLQK